MKKRSFVRILLIVLTSFSYHPLIAAVGEAPTEESFQESLKLRSLPNGHFFAHFDFTTTVASISNFTRLFPRNLAEILDAHNVYEMHLSLTHGYWRLESWGEPQLELPSSAAPGGAFVSAWFAAQDKEAADNNWRGLTSRLSGLSCASLNFLDSKTSVEPHYAYRPQGKLPSISEPYFVRVGSLPKEHTCTENFTPWAKLLPCGINRGLASLLRSKKIFSTLYHSSAIHVIRTGVGEEVKLVQSLSLVYDLSTGFARDENVARRIIGSLGLLPCWPASKTTLEIWKNGSWAEIDPSTINSLSLRDIPVAADSDLQFVFTPSKFLGGFGQEYGNMIIEMQNHLDRSLSVLYVEVLPWYVRPYFHTIQIIVNKSELNEYSIDHGERFHYTPGRNRERLHKLELDLEIPAKSTVTLTFTVEKGHLKWDEYPPDANHGFYLESSHFELNCSLNNERSKTRYYYTRKLLVDLSTPDFSMPYNVICLTCTVVALAFGPIHNITTRRLCLVPVVPAKNKFKKLVNKLLKRNVFTISDESTIATEAEGLSPLSSEDKENASSSIGKS